MLLALISDPIKVVWVILAYILIQQLENHILQPPVVMSHTVNLHPALVVFALLSMGALFGVVGIFLAIPLAAALQVLVRELWVERMNRIGTDPNLSRREPEKPKPPGPIRRVLSYLRS